MQGFQSSREFLVYHQDVLCAQASAVWLLVNAKTGHVSRITDEVRNAFDLLDKAVFDTPLPTRGKSLDNACEAYVGTVGRRDIDTNGHMNNIRYLEYALEALPEDVVRAPLPSTVDIVFRRQMLPGTKFRCLYGVTPGGRHQVELQSGDGTVSHAFVWFYD